jgi:segregation and condensation protein A
MKQPVVEFSALTHMSEDRIMDYLSLLFLASSRKIWLFQNELFEELHIYPGEESGFSTENNPPLFHQMKQGFTEDVLESEEAGHPEVLSFESEFINLDSSEEAR